MKAKTLFSILLLAITTVRVSARIDVMKEKLDIAELLSDLERDEEDVVGELQAAYNDLFIAESLESNDLSGVLEAISKKGQEQNKKEMNQIIEEFNQANTRLQYKYIEQIAAGDFAAFSQELDEPIRRFLSKIIVINPDYSQTTITTLVKQSIIETITNVSMEHDEKKIEEWFRIANNTFENKRLDLVDFFKIKFDMITNGELKLLIKIIENNQLSEVEAINVGDKLSEICKAHIIVKQSTDGYIDATKFNSYKAVTNANLYAGYVLRILKMFLVEKKGSAENYQYVGVVVRRFIKNLSEFFLNEEIFEEATGVCFATHTLFMFNVYHDSGVTMSQNFKKFLHYRYKTHSINYPFGLDKPDLNNTQFAYYFLNDILAQLVTDEDTTVSDQPAAESEKHLSEELLANRRSLQQSCNISKQDLEYVFDNIDKFVLADVDEMSKVELFPEILTIKAEDLSQEFPAYEAMYKLTNYNRIHIKDSQSILLDINHNKLLTNMLNSVIDELMMSASETTSLEKTVQLDVEHNYLILKLMLAIFSDEDVTVPEVNETIIKSFVELMEQGSYPKFKRFAKAALDDVKDTNKNEMQHFNNLTLTKELIKELIKDDNISSSDSTKI